MAKVFQSNHPLMQHKLALLRGTVFCAEAIPIVVGSNRCKAISESAIGIASAQKTVPRNDT